MNEGILKRLAALETLTQQETSFCFVETGEGNEARTTVEDWYEHRHEWRFKRFDRGSDNSAVYLLFAAWDEACGAFEDARKCFDEYKRRAV